MVDNGSKWTISASSGFELLHIVSKLDTNSVLARMLARMLDPKRVDNGSKWIISASGGFKLLQMVSKPDTNSVLVMTLDPQEGG